MNRRLVALSAVWSIVLAGLTLVGPATPRAVGHSQLVTSVPAAGDVVASPPSDLRLVFSEPIEAAYTRLDLLDSTGKTVVSGVGAPDPADSHSLIAPIPHLADGIYTVDWRALSASDGHTTSGFFTFGVGNVTPPPVGGSTVDAGSIHAGHDAATTFLETESRIAGDFGLLLALGLPIVGWLVLRHPRSVGVAQLSAASLGIAVVGAVGLIILGGLGVGFDPISYVAESRTGQLLLARAAVGIAAIVIVLVLARTRPSLASAIAAGAALFGVVLVALGGHAAAYDSPAPIAAVVVHLVGAAAWLTGILVLAWLAISGTPPDRPLAVLVPRFSAVGLVSVALIVLTGVYSDWLQTRTLISVDTPYEATLLVKIGLAIGAFSLGAFNYVSGGRATDRRFRPRVVVESGLAIAVLVATGVLASGSPPAEEQPVQIAVAPSSVLAGATPPVLELAPGRPGPTRFVVVATIPTGASVELELQRLDASGDSRIQLQGGLTPGTYEAGGGLLPAGSRWDASVVVHDQNGGELSRTRFSFALDSEGISEGRATAVVDPALAVAVMLLIGAALGLAFTLGGGSLPRVDPAASRIAVLGGSAAGTVLGVLALFGGPRL